MKAVARKVVGSLAGAVLITSVPLVLGVPFSESAWFKRIIAVCDWPMMSAKEHFGSLLQGNELDRLIEFFSINVVGWSLVIWLAYVISCAAARRTNISRSARGN